MHSIKLNFIENVKFDSIVNRWWLDQPKQAAIAIENDMIDLSGWIICADAFSIVSVITESPAGCREEFPLNVKRADAIKAVLATDVDINCGFRFKIKFETGTTHISFKINNQTYNVLTLSSTRLIKVLKGKSNFLFLANDTNRSTDQFTGALSLSTTALSNWNSHLTSLHREFSSEDRKACFLLAPAKEEIFPDFYPYPRATITPVDEFLSKIHCDFEILFPLDKLQRDRELTYSRVDSHWTDYGAKLAAEELLKCLGLSSHTSNLPNEFEVRSTTGDLGIKTSPPTFGPILSISPRYRKVHETFNNKINNNGRVRVYENPNAVVQHTLVIFGDSFSTNLAHLLTPIFSRVVYTYTGGGIDRSVIEFEKPKFITIQSNQRFIITPPPLDYNIWDNARIKLAQNDKTTLENLAIEMKTHFEGSSFFYARKMFDLINEVLFQKKC